MDNQKEKSEVLVKASAQGFSIAIRGKKLDDGSWICSVEKNEITFTEIPNNELASSLGEQRDYGKTEYKFSFEEAFKEFDDSEWFLCHPGKLHPEFADFIIRSFENRMADYNEQFPAASPMETFIRENKIKEWKSKLNKP